MAENRGDVSTYIGTDASFKGEISFEGGMRIDGAFEGKVTGTGNLQAGKNAKLNAEFVVGGIVVEGVLKGNVTAGERVELKSSAQVMGDVRSPRLVIAEGATFVGNVNVSPDALKTAAPAAQARETVKAK